MWTKYKRIILSTIWHHNSYGLYSMNGIAVARWRRH